MNHRTRKSERATILSSYKHSGRKIPYTEYYKLINDYMQFIADEIIEHGKEVILPAGCGRLQMVGKQVKPTFLEDGNMVGLAPDWKSTYALWQADPEAKKKKKKIFFFNEHSNGIRYKIRWSKSKLGPFSRFYFFQLTRTNKRTLAANIKAGKEYMVEAPKEKIYKN